MSKPCRGGLAHLGKRGAIRATSIQHVGQEADMKLYHTGEGTLLGGATFRAALSILDEPENLLDAAVSDEALEIASGSNAEAVPTLAFGSYCFTCDQIPNLRDVTAELAAEAERQCEEGYCHER
jgi:hypothetical protein